MIYMLFVYQKLQTTLVLDRCGTYIIMYVLHWFKTNVVQHTTSALDRCGMCLTFLVRRLHVDQLADVVGFSCHSLSDVKNQNSCSVRYYLHPSTKKLLQGKILSQSQIEEQLVTRPVHLLSNTQLCPQHRESFSYIFVIQDLINKYNGGRRHY